MRSKDCRPIFFSPALSMWVVTLYQEALTVLSEPHAYSSTLAYQGGPGLAALTKPARALFESVVPSATLHLASADPPHHRRLRSALEAHFSRAAITRFEPAVRAIADQLIDGFVHHKEADVVREFAAEMPVRSITKLIGIPDEDLPRVRNWYGDWIELSLMLVPAERQVRLVESFIALQCYLRDLIEQRRAAPAGDLASALVTKVGAIEDDVSDTELVNIFTQFFAAGAETTTAVMATCLYRLLSSPVYWDRVKSPETRARIVEEALRCNQAMRGLMRVATRDARIGDSTIPAGARIYVVNTAANRDAAIFSDADCFDADRGELKRHLAFGAGIHHCLGAALARVELSVALDRLHARLPGLEMVAGGVQFHTAPLVKSVGQLRVRWGRSS